MEVQRNDKNYDGKEKTTPELMTGIKSLYFARTCCNMFTPMNNLWRDVFTTLVPKLGVCVSVCARVRNLTLNLQSALLCKNYPGLYVLGSLHEIMTTAGLKLSLF